MVVDLDRTFHALGVFGRWQLSQIFLIKAAFFPAGFHLISIVFTGFGPPFYCNPPTNYTGDISYGGLQNNGALVMGECSIYDMTTNETLPCENGHSYHHNGTTIVTEWDLVCDRDYIPSVAQTVFIAGQAVGATFFAGLADKFGRRPILLLAHIMYFIVNMVMAFIPWLEFYMFLRFLSGYFQQGLIMMAAVLSLELLPMGYRCEVSLISSLSWATQMMLLTAFGYAFRNQTWRHMQLGLCLSSIIGVANFLFTDESVRWLYINNRVTEANKILKKGARINKKKVEDVLEAANELSELRPIVASVSPPDVLIQDHSINIDQTKNDFDNTNEQHTVPTQDQDAENSVHLSSSMRPDTNGALIESDAEKPKGSLGNESILPAISADKKDNVTLTVQEPQSVDTGQYSMLDVFRHPILRRTTLIMAWIWIVNSFVYFGLVMLSDTLSGDRFLNFFIGAVVEIPAGFACYIGIKRFGRKPSLYVFMGTSGVSLLIGVLLGLTLGAASGPAITALSLIGKAAITSSFNLVFMYTPELYPTNLRSFGAGIASTACRAGGMLAPFAKLLMKTLPWLPGTVFGVCAISAALLTTLLTETSDKVLPQNLEEMATWGRRKEKDGK